MQPRLFVQICALNEAQNIANVIAEIPRHIEGVASVTVVVVDDGSTDDTAMVARHAGADLVCQHAANQGLARAFQNAIDTCLNHGADIIVHTDADGQYEGACIPALIVPLLAHKADLVVGDRHATSLRHFSPVKRFLQGLGSWTVQAASGISVGDAVSGFRAYSREAALRLFTTNTFSYTVQTLIQAGKLGLAITSVPVRTRETKRPSRLHRGTLHFVSQQSLILIRTYITYEPLKTFFSLSFPLILFGLALLIRLMVIAAGNDGVLLGHVQSLIVGAVSVVIGLLLLITGIIADRVRENRRLLEEILYRARKRECDAASGRF
jgi:glycosyltransferase involved in cell wall biosynthesis